jgi:hypothetical protein
MDNLAGNIISKMSDDGVNIDFGIQTYPYGASICAIKVILGNEAFTSSGELVINAWNYVFFEYENSVGTLYINDLFDKETTGTITNHSYKLHVISNPGVTSCTPATIQLDSLKIYNGDDILSDAPSGADPKIMLEISNDGGASFGHEIWMSAGRVGKRLTRVRKNKLGWSRDRVYRISMSDPVKWIITGATEEVEVEND